MVDGKNQPAEAVPVIIGCQLKVDPIDLSVTISLLRLIEIPDVNARLLDGKEGIVNFRRNVVVFGGRVFVRVSDECETFVVRSGLFMGVYIVDHCTAPSSCLRQAFYSKIHLQPLRSQTKSLRTCRLINSRAYSGNLYRAHGTQQEAVVLSNWLGTLATSRCHLRALVVFFIEDACQA